MANHWYRVEVLAGAETHHYFGSSALGEERMMGEITEGKFISLDDLTFYDEDGEAKAWTDWDPNYIPRIHLNPRYVVTVIPLSHDPRHTAREGDEPVMLRYPGRSQEGEGWPDGEGEEK